MNCPALIVLTALALPLSTGLAGAQSAVIPKKHQALYRQLGGQLAQFAATVPGTGTDRPVLRGAAWTAALDRIAAGLGALQQAREAEPAYRRPPLDAEGGRRRTAHRLSRAGRRREAQPLPTEARHDERFDNRVAQQPRFHAGDRDRRRANDRRHQNAAREPPHAAQRARRARPTSSAAGARRNRMSVTSGSAPIRNGIPQYPVPGLM